MALTIFALLAVAGLYYLSRHYFKAEPATVAPTTGPRAGGFSIADIFGAGFLAFFFSALTFQGLGKTPAITIDAIMSSGVFYLTLVGTLVILLIARGRNPIRLFGLNWQGWPRQLPRIFLALICLYPTIFVVQSVMEKFFDPSRFPQPILIFLASDPGVQAKLTIAFFAIVIAPLAEEVIFRGYIFGAARQFIGRWPAIIVSSLVFAFIHGHIPALPGLFVLAIFLALVYERTGSLWAPIMLHAFFNSVTVVVTLFFPSALR